MCFIETDRQTQCSNGDNTTNNNNNHTGAAQQHEPTIGICAKSGNTALVEDWKSWGISYGVLNEIIIEDEEERRTIHIPI